MPKRISSKLKSAFDSVEKEHTQVSSGRAKSAFLELLGADSDARVLHNLAFCYSEGFGTKKDYKKALRLYRLAAKAGSLGAYFNIGNMYENGQGVQRNEKKAFQYFKLGAAIGDVWSHLNIGWYYYNGVGTSISLELAEFHWRTAARKKIPSALYSLGILYSSLPNESSKNLKQAIKFFETAIRIGHERSKSALVRTQKKLKRLGNRK